MNLQEYDKNIEFNSKKIGVFEIKNEITSEQCKLFTKMAE